jgi:hypothetical protein
MRRVSRGALILAPVLPDADHMDVSRMAPLQVQALVLSGARASLDQAREHPLPADASPAEHANVVLELSSAARSLLAR